MIEQSEYRALLQDLHSDLLDEDVKCMKFLAQPLVQKRLYEGIQDGLSLFGALEDCGMLSNRDLTFLMELCETVGRVDIQNRIDEEIAVGMDAVSGKDPLICPFRRLLYKLYREIPDYDLSRMRYLYGKIPKRATVSDPLDFFGFMLRDGSLKPEDCNALKTIFSEISRQDLVEEISFFEITVRPEDCNYTNRRKLTTPKFQEASLESNTYLTSSSKDPSDPSYMEECGMSYQESDQEMHGLVFQQVSIEDHSCLETGQFSYSFTDQALEGLKSANCGETSPSIAAGMYSTVGALPPQPPMPPTVHSLAAGDDIEMLKAEQKMNSVVSNCYKMTSDPRGLCIIIDVQKFVPAHLKFRAGSEYDRSNLKFTFERLKFKVEENVNPGAGELYRYLTDVARRDHTAYDSIVICILSHGGINYFYGRDGEKVSEERVFGLFSAAACSSLANKPKLFFFSYCRGTEEQGGVPVIDTDSPTVADLSDFLYGYATPQNYVSYRNKHKGTFYIEVLTRVLNEEAERLELQHILLQVNREVSKMSTGTDKRQIPEPKHTLQRQLYFL